ncbi:MAG: histidine phosphatase family protein [Myxococcaceae bacterium]|nr:histidine phosphatase family protein [Myxococcaceae bacterium]
MFYLVRHAETLWNVEGRQTSYTELGLTSNGEEQARRLRPFLNRIAFHEVWCSPLVRVRQTCRLAGYQDRAELWNALVEWNAGEYEGMLEADIQKKQPDWAMMLHGAPGGESMEDVECRIAPILSRMKQTQENILIFSHSYTIRAIAAAWIGQPLSFGVHLPMARAAVSVLDDENQIPAIRLWSHSCEV